ncbi:MFS transporter, partial [Rhodococcus sp. NPDC057014]
VLLIAGSIVGAIGYFVVAFAHDTEIDIYLATSLIGIGFGLAFSAMSNVVVAAVPPEQTGVASGMNANIRTIGGSVGAALMASIVTAGASSSGVPQESGYTHGFVVLGTAVGLGAVAAMFIPALNRDKTTRLEESAALRHPELAMVAGGTLVGDESE